MKYVLFLCIFSALLPPSLPAQTIPVALQKDLWPDARGELSITQEGIEFNATDKKQSRAWTYRDIQSIDRRSKTELVILSYEDQRWKLGRDKRYTFRSTSGEFTDQLFDRIQDRLAKPVTNRVIGQVSGAEYQLPVKHLHALGGCEGQLIFAPEAIYYQTEHAEDARVWRLNADIASVWSSQPFEFEVHVYENNRREFSATRIFKFSLKERLDPEFYRNLKLRIYNRDASHAQVP